MLLFDRINESESIAPIIVLSKLQDLYTKRLEQLGIAINSVYRTFHKLKRINSSCVP